MKHKLTFILLTFIFFTQCQFFKQKTDSKPLPKSIVIQFFLAKDQLTPGYKVARHQGHKIYMKEEPALSSKDIKSYAIKRNQFDIDTILLNFTEKGSQKLAQTTANNIREKLAIVINGTVVSAPIIMAPITAGQAVIDFGPQPEGSNKMFLQFFKDDFGL